MVISSRIRHAAWIDAATNKGSAWSGAFATPIDMDGVLTLLAAFTVSCPSTNPDLPFIVRTPLALDPAAPAGGQATTVAFNTSVASDSSDLFLAFSSGMNTTFQPLQSAGGNFTTSVPGGFQGAVFAFVTNGTTVPIPRDAILTAPAILQFPFDSHADNAQ